MAILLLVLDGLGDIRWEGKPTPLEEAHTPHMDRLAEKGAVGFHTTIGRGKVVGSDVGHLALFGYSLSHYPGRGPLEALGAGLELRPGEGAMRVNLATVEGGKVVDRRAGRPPTEVGKALEGLLTMEVDGFEFVYRHTTEHRGVLLIRGPGPVAEVEGNDPHREGLPYTYPRSQDKALEKALRKYLEKAHRLLEGAEVNRERAERGLKKANALLLRGFGRMKEVESFEEKHGIRGAAVAGGALYKGVARYVGLDVVEVEGATGDKNTDLEAKGRAAARLAGEYPFVFLHVKATDSFGHDGDYEGKKAFIEKVDRELMPLVEEAFSTIALTGDHSTPWALKGHSFHPVPLLIASKPCRRDRVKVFHEYACMEGGLGMMEAKDVLEVAKGLEGLQPKVGS